jgi:hypothetical protein
MQGQRFALAMSLAAAVLVGALGVASLALAQSDAELEALNRQVIRFRTQAKPRRPFRLPSAMPRP